MSTKKVVNPETGRQITVEGKSFKSLWRTGKYKWNETKTQLMTIVSDIPVTVPKALPEEPTVRWTAQEIKCCSRPEYLIHISDIHIPIGLSHKKREDEFKYVFNNLYRMIENEVKKHTKDSVIIVVTGDLLDSKTKLEPLTIVLARDFLISLSNYAPVILIAGNHDMNEANIDELCSLTAICHGISDRVIYLQWSGVYKIGGVLFAVSSLKDKKFIRYSDINCDNVPVIALYHGSISGSKTDTGHSVGDTASSIHTSRYRKKSDFDGYLMVLLGDIHKYQVLREDGTMAYAGSLLQQNAGESLRGHGFNVWDIANRLHVHHEVENKYGIVKLLIVDGQMTIEGEIPSIPTFVCDLEGTSLEQLEAIKKTLESDYKPKDIIVRRSITKGISHQVSNAVSDHDLITPCLIPIHDKIASKCTEPTAIDGCFWRIISIEFQNLFSYGDNHVNKIDFAGGVYNISAPNQYGKSSICNLILFALFDHIKATEALNNRATSGYVKVLFVHNNVKYSLKRQCSSLKSNANVFYRLEPDENLTRSTATETMKLISQMLGTAENFIINNTLLPSDTRSLLRMTPADRMRKLEELFGLERYKNYEKEAKAVLKTITTEKQKLSLELNMTSTDFKEDVTNLKNNLENIVSRMTVLATEIAQHEEEKKKLEGDLRSVEADLITLQRQRYNTENPGTYDEKDLESKLKSVIKIIGDKERPTNSEDLLLNKIELLGGTEDLEDVESRVSIKCLKTKEQLEQRWSEMNHDLNTLRRKYPSCVSDIEAEIVRLQKYLEGTDLPSNAAVAVMLLEDKVKKQTVALNRTIPVIDPATIKRSPLAVSPLMKNYSDRDLEQSIETIRSLHHSLTGLQEYCKGVDPISLEHRIVELKTDNGMVIGFTENMRSEVVTVLRLTTDEVFKKLESTRMLLKEAEKMREDIIESMNHNAEVRRIISENEEIMKYNRRIDDANEYMNQKKLLEDLKADLMIAQSALNLESLIEQKRLLCLVSEYSEIAVGLQWYRDTEKISLMKNLALMKSYSTKDNIEKKQSKIKAWKELSSINERLTGIENRCKDIKIALNAVTKSLTTKEKEMIKLESSRTVSELNLEANEQKRIKISQFKTALQKVTEDEAMYTQYLELVGRKGIPLSILKSNLSTMEGLVNSIFGKYTRYKLKLECDMDKSKIEVSITEADSNGTTYGIGISRLCGVEDAILNISLKSVANRLAPWGRSSLFIIDERFDCIDENNWINVLPDIFQMLKMDYSDVLFISHRTIPSELIDHRIVIEKTGHISRVNYY